MFGVALREKRDDVSVTQGHNHGRPMSSQDDGVGVPASAALGGVGLPLRGRLVGSGLPVGSDSGRVVVEVDEEVPGIVPLID